MMHFTPGPLCMFRSGFDVSGKQAQLSGCCGDAKHLWPHCLSGQCHRGKGCQGAVLEGRQAHLAAASPGSAAAKARGLSLLQHGLCPPSLCQPPSLRSGKFLFACGAEEPWTVPAWIRVQMELLLQLCSRKLQGLCSPGHVLHKVGPERSCSTHGTGTGEKEELLDL